MNFNHVNIETGKLHLLIQAEQEHVSDMITMLESSECLCDDIGCSIVAEYGFKGDKEAVLDQLLSYGHSIENFTDDDRAGLLKRKEKYFLFFQQNDNDAQNQAIIKLLQANTMEAVAEIGNVMEDKMMLRKIAHDNKMCLCFTNI